jgi:hypothetical protein
MGFLIIKNMKRYFSYLGIVLPVLVLILTRCTYWTFPNKKGEDYKGYTRVWVQDVKNLEFYNSEIALSNDFVFRYRANTSPTEISAFENRLQALFQNIKIESCKCDPLLRRYTNLELFEIIKNGAKLVAKPNGDGAGDPEKYITLDNVQFASPTYITHADRDSSAVDSVGKVAVYKKELLEKLGQYPETAKGDGQEFRIGVLDTGYDFQNKIGNDSFSSKIVENLPGDMRGCSQRNFITNDSDIPQDDDKTRHGTIVTTLLLAHLPKVPVKVFPIKVLDSLGKGNLHNLLCALASQDELQLTAFNLSLGFYAEETVFPGELLSIYMKRNPAWFFVAAGNKSLSKDVLMEASNRDLTSRKFKFYPACLTDVAKMITVTTVNKLPESQEEGLEVCQTQNFSSNYVHLGVVSHLSGECLIGVNGVGGVGSSFATPVGLGKTILSWWRARNNPGDDWFPRVPINRYEIFGRPYPAYTQNANLPDGQILGKRVVNSLLEF